EKANENWRMEFACHTTPRTYGYIRWRRATTHSDEADRMSIAASEEELMPDEAEESTEQLPAAVAAQSEADAELGAMLLRAPKSSRLVVRKAPSPEPSQPLCPQNAATWRNRPRLPSKACKLSSALAAKAYSAAGQAASALHAMDILQVLQAQALKQLHEGRPDKGLMQELRMATDFTLRATKVTARSLGQVMAACGDYGSSGEGRNQPAEMKLGFYSPYFIVPKKNSGLRPILDLRVLNRSLHKMPFKMLMHYFLHLAPGLVRSHRPEGRVLSCLDFVSTQTVSSVCFRGLGISVQSPPLRTSPVSPRIYQTCGGCPRPTLGAGHPHPQLSGRLADNSSLSRSVVRAQGSGASAPQSLGASGQLGEEQALPCAEHLFSWDGAGFGQYDGAPHEGEVSAQLSEFIQTQHSCPSKDLSEAPGAYGSCSRGHATQLASYETASALAPWPDPEMGMAPWHISGRCYTNVLLRDGVPLECRLLFSPWSDLAFLWAGVPLGQISRHVIVNTDASSTGWGAVCNRQAASSSWTGPQLQWHINCLELLAVFLILCRFRLMLRGEHVLVRTDNMMMVTYINHQGGLHCLRMSQLACYLLLWSLKCLKSLRAVHIPGELNRAADALSRQLTLPGEWRLHPQVDQLIWNRFGEAQIDLARSRSCWLRSIGPPGPGSWNSCLGDGHHLAPVPRSMEPSCMASGRDAADLSGLPQAVIDTVTQARAPSTRQAYALRWGLFVVWCSSHQDDPQRCSVVVVVFFLQEKLEQRLSPSTLKIYVAAIVAYYDTVDGLPLGRHHLIIRFLRGARRLNPPRSHLIPSWVLSVVLKGLRRDPFEPLESVELKYLSLKTSLLIALTSIKRVGDLHAFSVNESCLEFGPADSHVRLRPRPGYVPKVPTTPFRDQVVNLQALPPEEADPALGLLCPVQAFRIYVGCTQSFRRSEKLFVCFGGQQKRNAVSKQRLAHWVVDAITLAYQCQ
ncbi:hypothetical protein M9458_051861, partial [Cirrhinus mrigala]